MTEPAATPTAEAHEHSHVDISGGWLRAAVFGAMDGLVTNTALVAGVGGGRAAASTIVLSGVASLVAGAISMALGEYTSVKTQNEQLDLEVAKERRELERNPEGELAELIGMLRVRGVDEQLAHRVAVQLSRDPETALRLHVVAELGMSPEAAEAFARSIRQPYGAVITCGPTGSGKTTTLYAALDLLNDEERVLMTIEDPVEYQIAGINQVEVNAKAGLTFARGLRTILRSDPDVLLVGEIRDEETARIAIQAAMTGHLVLTTLHTHNAASSIARLKDMGVEPSILATSINCIVAQRLARRLCERCKEAYTPTREELATARFGLLEAEPVPELYRPVGCTACGHTGYKGRLALHEVMAVSEEIERLTVERASAMAINKVAVEQGMITLRRDGLTKVKHGLTSIEEIFRVVA